MKKALQHLIPVVIGKNVFVYWAVLSSCLLAIIGGNKLIERHHEILGCALIFLGSLSCLMWVMGSLMLVLLVLGLTILSCAVLFPVDHQVWAILGTLMVPLFFRLLERWERANGTGHLERLG